MAEVAVAPLPQGASELGADGRDTQEKPVAAGQSRAVYIRYMSETNTRGTECVRRARSGL